ncbi:MAG: PAS domain-containing protein [Bacteroidales bacterium]
MELSLGYLEHFFHGAPAGIALVTSRMVDFANNQMAEITGYSKKELTGKYVGIFYPNERESKRMEKSFYLSLKEKGMAAIETKWRRRKGETVDVFIGGMLLHYKSDPMSPDVRKETILMVAFDITRRKYLEKGLRNNELAPEEVLETTGEGFWHWDIESGSVQFSDTWLRMFGYRKKELEPHIRTWQKLIHPEDWHHVRKALNDHLWGDAGCFSSEYRLKSKSGKWIRVFDFGKVTGRDDHNYPLRFMGSMTDITFLKKIEQKTYSAENKLGSLTRSESPYIPAILRKKSTTAKGMEVFCRLLRNPFISEDQRDYYLDLMLNSGSRIHQFVHHLMNLSRLHSDQLDFQPGEFNIHDMLNRLYRLFLPLAKRKEIHLQVIAPFMDDRNYVYSDETRIQQILHCLLENAFRFTDEGAIEFGYNHVDGELRFFVKDTGKGVDKGREQKIFEPFYTSVADSEAFGAGLGLTVARGLAGLLEGNLWVQSEKDAGSVFYLTIPYVTYTHDNRTDIKDALPAEIQAHQPEVTVLIVEDDHSNAVLLREILKCPELSELNLNVQFATNGREAVNFCKQNKADIVLMDIKLPVMDGLTASRTIKLLRPDLPIIAQTACANPTDKANIFAAGCNDYLVKPFSMNTLRQKLRKHLIIGNRPGAFYEN